MVLAELNPYEVLAVGVNAAMVFVTAWMAYSTKQMARQTKDSVAVERDAMDRAKDSLMPILHAEWHALDPSDDNSGFMLQVFNQGVGPAFIHEITTREEVDLHHLYRSILRSTIVRAGTTAQETFGRSAAIRVNKDLMSSLSIWYTDVYGRWYRTRIIVQYPRSYAEHEWTPALTRVTEFLRDIPAPSFSYGELNNLYPDNYVGRFL